VSQSNRIAFYSIRRSFSDTARPVMERLERRQLLSVYTVTSNADTIADDGVMTLREAVLDANAHANDAADPSGPIDKIVFNIPSGKTSDVQTISLGSGLKVTDAVVIDGYTQGDASRNTLPIGSDAKLRIQIAGDVDPFDLQRRRSALLRVHARAAIPECIGGKLVPVTLDVKPDLLPVHQPRLVKRDEAIGVRDPFDIVRRRQLHHRHAAVGLLVDDLDDVKRPRR